ncbi:MAG: ribbon-helix-helix domain-containing protein [Xanthobacteraceae bacterium]
MPKSIRVKPKRRGRPATGKDPFYGVRMPDDLVAAVDKWGADNEAPSRSDAIRRLIELGLHSRGRKS